MHRRFVPKAHGFVYRIFLFAIDLDELALLQRRLALLSFKRPNIYRFADGDYLPSNEPLHNGRAGDPTTPAAPLKERITAFLAAQGVDLAGGRVMLVTLPRVFGYLFNPVSFYFCFDRSGAPVASLAEVTNTFKEMKTYLVEPVEKSGTGTFHLRAPKYFYVSPYSDVDVEFDFTLQVPGDRLSVQIDDYAGATRTLTSTVAGVRRELTNTRLAWFTLKYPLITLRIISSIHWHALLLWLKRVPWFAKAARAGEQRALRRPHASIAQTPHFEPPSPPASVAKPENC